MIRKQKLVYISDGGIEKKFKLETAHETSDSIFPNENFNPAPSLKLSQSIKKEDSYDTQNEVRDLQPPINNDTQILIRRVSQLEQNIYDLTVEFRSLQKVLMANLTQLKVRVNPIKKISSKEQLFDAEKELGRLLSEDIITYNTKVAELSASIQKPNTGYTDSHGLVFGFMDAYFSQNFTHSMGWTNKNDRIPFKELKNHKKFIMDVVNSNRPKTFANIDSTSKSINNFFKRVHEKRQKQLKLSIDSSSPIPSVSPTFGV